MLPSRGISKANPASALRYPLFPTRAQLARPSPASTRSFSRSSIRSPSISSKHGLSRPTQIPQLASIGSGSGALGVASGVFAQRSGTTRNLSLWPFQSKPSEATAPPPVDTRIEPAASFAEPPTSVPDAQPPPVPVESVSPASAATPATPIDPSSTHLSHDSVFGDLDLPSILDIPEQIGYLKSLGLDFGWGPTSCVEWVLEHVYIYTGAPWWASLAMIAIVWRAALFMPTMTGSKHQALLQKAHTTPEFIKAKEQFNEAAFGSKDQMAMMSARASMSKITRQSGAQIWRPFVGFLTVPFSYGMFRLFRAMAAIPVPSLETGGLAWFTDLTVHDPYFILPALSVGLGAMMMRQLQKANMSQDSAQQAMAKGMIYILPPALFLGTAWLPAGLQWFFLMLSAGSTVQSAATLNPTVRRWAGLPPLPSSPAALASAAGAQWQAPVSRGQGIVGSVKKDMGDMSKGIKRTFGNDGRKASSQKANEYEERRANEEREKAYRRMEAIRQKRAEQQR